MLNTRVTAVISEINAMEAGVRHFRDTYGAIPGDLPNPGSRLPRCGAPTCNTSEVANGDGMIGMAEESRKFWQHLGLTGFLKNVKPDEWDYQKAAPRNALKGHSIMWFNIAPIAPGSILEGNILSIADGSSSWGRMLLPHVVMIDSKMDDGKPHTGELRVGESPVCHVAGENTYLSAPRTQECLFMTVLRGDE